MATPLTQAIIDADPIIQSIARSSGGTGRGDTRTHLQANQRLLAYLQAKGYEFPQGQWVDQSGKLADLPKGMNWWALLAPASVAAGAGLAAALGGGAATTAGTIGPMAGAETGMAATEAALAAPAGVAASGGGVGGALAGAAGAATAGKSLWSKIAAPLIMGGLDLGQGIISSRAANKAAEQQQAATMAALNLQREIWEKQQANLAPYMQTGTGALGRLNGLTTLRPASQVFGG